MRLSRSAAEALSWYSCWCDKTWATKGNIYIYYCWFWATIVMSWCLHGKEVAYLLTAVFREHVFKTLCVVGKERSLKSCPCSILVKSGRRGEWSKKQVEVQELGSAGGFSCFSQWISGVPDQRWLCGTAGLPARSPGSQGKPSVPKPSFLFSF